MRRWRMVLAALAATLLVAAGQGRAETGRETGDAAAVERNLAALGALADSLAVAIAEREALLAEAENPETSAARKRELTSMIETERQRVEQLRRNFRDVIGGTEEAGFASAEDTETTVQDQLGELLKPIVAALREPTDRLRDLENLREQAAAAQLRRDMAARVVARIDALRAEPDAGEENPRLAAELESGRRLWEARRSEAAGQYEVLRLMVDESERDTPTFWQATTRMTGDFVKSRGLNLLLALAAGALGFILIRRGYAWLRAVSPVHKHHGGSLFGRASDLVAFTAAVLVAVICVMAVFFARGDWLLVTVTAKVDFTHAAAPRLRFIPRLIQRVCVDVCNQRGWTIPFTQITLHKAGG